jgi:Spy/CpxP family protein refolding chaperone
MMKSPLTRTGLIAGAALSLAAAGVTFAQAPAPGAPPARGPGMMHKQHDPAQMADRLRAALQLTPAQEPALQAFIAAMKPPADMGDHMKGDRDDWKNLTTPQRLDRMQAMQAQHQQHMAAHIDAVKRFYAALTPSQQKAFDAMHDGMMGRGHRMGGHMGGDRRSPGMMPPSPVAQ